MKAKLKFGGSILAVFMAFLAAMMCFISLPLVSNAETGTLGSESPEIYCTYAQDGVAVDGNELTAGTYDVSFVLSGVKSLSVVQITATYDESVVTAASAPSYSISDSADLAMDSMGYILSGGNIVLGFVSENVDCSSVSEEEQILATVSMTFASDCDAADYITVSQDPNLTFLQVDYGDGYDDQYALVDSYPGYDGNLYLMSCDVTPVVIPEYTVNGQIKIATDLTGTTTTVGIVGITVTVEKDGETIASAVTDENGYYTLPDVPVGEYTMTFSGPTTIDRTVTLSVSTDKAVDRTVTVDSVGIVICDYNKDTVINVTDKVVFAVAYSDAYDVYCDFNGDAIVNAADKSVFGAFYGQTIEYSNIVL